MLAPRTGATLGRQPDLLSEAHAAIPSESQERFGVGSARLWWAVHFRERAVAKAPRQDSDDIRGTSRGARANGNDEGARGSPYNFQRQVLVIKARVSSKITPLF